jgi:hypothetical protein
VVAQEKAPPKAVAPAVAKNAEIVSDESAAISERTMITAATKQHLLKCVLVATLGQGHAFGEVALLKREPRNATIMAAERTQMATLSSLDYNRILKALHVERLKSTIAFLSSVPLLKEWPLILIRELATEATHSSPVAGTVLTKQGAPAEMVHIIREGEIKLCISCEFDQQIYSGELKKEFRAASAHTRTDFKDSATSKVRKSLEMGIASAGQILGVLESLHEKIESYCLTGTTMLQTSKVLSVSRQTLVRKINRLPAHLIEAMKTDILEKHEYYQQRINLFVVSQRSLRCTPRAPLQFSCLTAALGVEQDVDPAAPAELEMRAKADRMTASWREQWLRAQHGKHEQHDPKRIERLSTPQARRQIWPVWRKTALTDDDVHSAYISPRLPQFFGHKVSMFYESRAEERGSRAHFMLWQSLPRLEKVYAPPPATCDEVIATLRGAQTERSLGHRRSDNDVRHEEDLAHQHQTSASNELSLELKSDVLVLLRAAGLL